MTNAELRKKAVELYAAGGELPQHDEALWLVAAALTELVSQQQATNKLLERLAYHIENNQIAVLVT